ncbi:MAG: hypothetical protein KAW12_00175 [Candidatus Aminicenantes bacterium]|nr:hypothetical protein [Candidatus Aminicenantes bacterium]
MTKKIETTQIETPPPAKTGNPWIDKFGCFKDDPTFDNLEAEIDSYRKEIDSRSKP